MHNFRELVGPGRKEDPREHEVVEELAGHLEEMFLELRRSGSPEEDALARVSAVGERLGPTVRRLRWQREGGLRAWLRAVVLPGLTLSFFYEACRALLVDFYWQHSLLWHEASLALIGIGLGFCASFFSRELGGSESQRRWAGMSVLTLELGVWCFMALVVTPIQVFQDAHYWQAGTGKGVVVSLLWAFLWSVVIPAVGLAAGATFSAFAFSPPSTDLGKAEVA